MGREFEGETSYSRMMSHLMVLIAYSSGMPILYFVGFAFFFLTFMVEKWNLILIFQKTTTLNRVIPKYSESFLNFIIFQHLIFGALMITDPGLFDANTDKEDLVDLGDFLNFEKDQGEKSMLASRVHYLHQKIYLAFIVGAVITYVGSSFILGLIGIMIDQIKILLNWIKKTIVSCCLFCFNITQRKSDKVGTDAAEKKPLTKFQKTKMRVMANMELMKAAKRKKERGLER